MTDHKNWTVPEVSPGDVIPEGDRLPHFGLPYIAREDVKEAERAKSRLFRAALDEMYTGDFGSMVCDAYIAPDLDDEDREILGKVLDVQFTEAMIEAGIGAVSEVCGEAVGSRDANELIARRIFIAMRRAETDGEWYGHEYYDE